MGRLLLFLSLALSYGLARAQAEPVAGAAAPSYGAGHPGAEAVRFPQQDIVIPGNGSVLLNVYGAYVGGWGLHDLEDHMLDASRRVLDRYWIITPARPFPPGAAAFVYALSTESSRLARFTVVFGPARSPQRPQLTVPFGVELRTFKTEMGCCRQLRSVPTRQSCFPMRVTTAVVGTATLSSPEDQSALSQVLFRVRGLGSNGADAARFQPTTEALDALVWSSRANEYCIEVDALELGTDEHYAYPELSRCVAHGSLGEVGDLALPIDASLLAHGVCEIPPDPIADQWCQINQAACADTPTSFGCSAYGAVCRGEPLPNPWKKPEPEHVPARVTPMKLDQSLCSTFRVHGSAHRGWLLCALAMLARRRRGRALPL